MDNQYTQNQSKCIFTYNTFTYLLLPNMVEYQTSTKLVSKD